MINGGGCTSVEGRTNFVLSSELCLSFLVSEDSEETMVSVNEEAEHVQTL